MEKHQSMEEPKGQRCRISTPVPSLSFYTDDIQNPWIVLPETSPKGGANCGFGLHVIVFLY